MVQLGKIEKIKDLRKVWPHEAYDFSKWLAKEENLTMLSEAIDINIILEELESPVGKFNVDLYAYEEGTGRKIIIENQLEDTDHDHLGKIITYASGKAAEVVVWIVKRAKDEHRQAVEWLNQHTDEKIGFFLIEIELWKINDSLPAPKFNVVERPNDWAKSMKAVDGLSETKKLQLEFWNAFKEYAEKQDNIGNIVSFRKPQPQHWYDISVGNSSLHIALTVNTQKKCLGAEIYINDDKELYEKYKKNKELIEKELNQKLEWRMATKDCRILAKRVGDIKKGEEVWHDMFDWFIDMSLKLRDIIKKYGV